MLLAIDVGNTNTVCAVFDGETLRGQWRLATQSERTSDEYAVALQHVLQLSSITLAQVDAAIIASVVPATIFPLHKCLRDYTDVTPLIIGSDEVTIPMEVRIDRPSEAGADRLVNAYAACQHYGGPLVVLDFGTATTFDVVGAHGEYAGGIIAPGINLSIEALHRHAAKLPNVAVRRPEKVIGTNTVGAMQSGLYYGYLGLIEGIIHRIQDELNAKPTVVATGGLAPLFVRATEVIDHLAPDLTINGLRLIYEANQ